MNVFSGRMSPFVSSASQSRTEQTLFNNEGSSIKVIHSWLLPLLLSLQSRHFSVGSQDISRLTRRGKWFENWGHCTPLGTDSQSKMPLFQFWERFSSRSTMGSSKITRWIRSSYVGSLLQVLRLYPQERPAGWRTGGSFLLLASSQQSRLSLLMTPWSPSINTGAW